MDYDSLLNIKTKYHTIIIIWVIMVSLIFVVIVLQYKIYDNYNTLGVYNEGLIFVNLPIDYSDTFSQGDYLKINDLKYTYEIIEISDMYVDEGSMVNYQTISLKLDESFLNNEVLNITVYSNLETIAKKAADLLIERS